MLLLQGGARLLSVYALRDLGGRTLQAQISLCKNAQKAPQDKHMQEPQGALWSKPPIAPKQDNVIALVIPSPILRVIPQLYAVRAATVQAAEQPRKDRTPDTEYERVLASNPVASVVLTSFFYSLCAASGKRPLNWKMWFTTETPLPLGVSIAVCGSHGGSQSVLR